MNRRKSKTWPDSVTEQLSYDAVGNLTEQVDPKGQLAKMGYDALNRQTLREYHEGLNPSDLVLTEASTWDANNNLLSVVESAPGEADATTTYTYDTFDRQESATDRWNNTVRTTYDANGNRTRLEDPDGQLTQYSYDALNRVSSVLVPGSGATTYEYFANSRLRQVNYPNGTSASYTYDSANRTKRIENRHNTTALVSSFEYDYDTNGNRISQVETRGGQAPETTTYTYDLADRLYTVLYPEKTVAYTYDNVGNRRTETESEPLGAVLSEKVFSYNGRSQVTSVEHVGDPSATVSYGYDENGNQISRVSATGSTTFTFDVKNRLVEAGADGSTLGSYRYNFMGLRVQKNTVDSGEERYVYDQQSVLLRRGAAGASTKYEYGPTC